MTHTVTQQIAAAREYLADIKHHRADELPWTVLVRECAELRRRLCEVLAAIDAQPAPLDSSQMAVVLGALAEAIAHRQDRVDGVCWDCAESPVELCDKHSDDLDAADRYRAVERALMTGDQR